jgi:DNA sulfur modification protein DndB
MPFSKFFSVKEESSKVTSLSELTSRHQKSTYSEMEGVLAQTFGHTTLSTTLPVSKLLTLYAVDPEVQRSIHPRNLSKLMDYIMLYLNDQQPIYFPGIILSARGVGEYDAQANVYRLHPLDKLYVIDGQHRLAAFQRVMESLQSALKRAKEKMDEDQVNDLTEKLRKLYAFPLSTMIYMNLNMHEERQLFSDINKLPRKIGGNLAVLRDQRPFYHVLATQLLENDPVFQKLEIDTFSERGKGDDFHFSYHFIIELLVALFEGRLKPAARNNSYHFTQKELDTHAAHASLYFEKLMEHLPPPSRNEISWSDEVQIALALLFHDEAVRSNRFNKYALEHAMNILPFIPWEQIFSSEEETQLPRRAKTMHAYEFLKRFFAQNRLFLLSDKEVN